MYGSRLSDALINATSTAEHGTKAMERDSCQLMTVQPLGGNCLKRFRLRKKRTLFRCLPSSALLPDGPILSGIFAFEYQEQISEE